MNKILTIDQLIKFCEDTHVNHFNASENNTTIVLSTYGEVKYSANEDPTLMSVALKACHIGLNRNNSSISEDVMKVALPSFSNKPILAEIVDTEDGKDFGSHAMEIVEDEDGNETMHYIEKCVGIIPESCNAHLEYDKEMDKTYVIVDGYIFNDYGNEAASIIQKKNGTKVSVELGINDFSWNASEKCLEINDFFFMGVTLLGESVGEGMLGSRLDMSFSKDNNIDPLQKYESQLIEMQEKLDTLLSRFNINNTSEEGGTKVNKFEELLAKYNKTVEDIDFDYENMSDEDLEAKFAELFDEGTEGDGDGEDPEDPSDDGAGEGENDTAEEPVITDDNACGGGGSGKKKKKYTIELEDGQVSTFEISLNEKICALEQLVNIAYSESDNAYYCVKAYENYVVMVDYCTGAAYRQTYSEDSGSYSLTGDRVSVHACYLTDEEEANLMSMKSEYVELKQYKSDKETSELHAQREAILADQKFESVADSEEFKSLSEKMDEYSVDELEKEAKVILADKFSATFALEPKKPEHKTIGFSLKEDKSESPYGNLFSKEK